MKILAAIVVPPTVAASGAMNAAVRLSEALSAHVQVDVASMAPLPSALVGPRPVPVRTWNPLDRFGDLPARWHRTLFHASSIPDLIRHGDYDLVHIHNPIPPFEMRRVARACLERGLPYVVHTHGFVEVSSGPRAFDFPAVVSPVWRLLLERPVAFAVRHAARAFALSPADLPVLERLGCPADRVRIVTNGVDRAAFDPVPEQRLESVCRSYGIPYPKPTDRVVCFFLGNHVPNKGVGILLEAFTTTTVPYLLILGGKTREWIDYRGYRRRLGPGQEIVVTDRIAEADVSAIHGYADLFVFPSLADTFPLVILDAMAHGVPVLATEVGGIPFQLEGGCGRLVPPGDAHALRAQLERLAGDRETLRGMGRRGRQRVAEHFDWNRAAEAALAAYREVAVTDRPS